MDFKKTNAPTTTVTRDLVDFVKDTGNIYESVAIMGKRANQISVEMKEELKSKLEEFSSSTDNLDLYQMSCDATPSPDLPLKPP